MGTRVKDFVATGIAPDGRLYAGDLNAMQDDYADLTNLSQTIAVGTVQIGETGLQLSRFGALDARISGSFRADKIIRGLGGFLPGAFTTAARNAIAQADRPYGVAILNTDLNVWEWNRGTDVSPNWQPLGQATVGTFATMPAAGSAGRMYWDTTNKVMWVDHGTRWEPLDGAYPGMEMDYTGAVASLSGLQEVFPHWLLENGATITNTAPYDRLYPLLAVAGTLPNARGRVSVYRDDVNFTRGATGGEINHTLTIAEMPSHTHIVPLPQWPVTGGSGSGGSGIDGNQTSGAAGGGGAHNNMPPYYVTGARLVRY